MLERELKGRKTAHDHWSYFTLSPIRLPFDSAAFVALLAAESAVTAAKDATEVARRAQESAEAALASAEISPQEIASPPHAPAKR